MGNRVVGGVLLLVHALVGIVFSIYVIILIQSAEWGGFLFFEATFTLCPAILLVFNIIVLLGAMAAIKGIAYPLAVIGGVFALIQGDFIFGLAGLILVATAKDEF